MSEVELSRKTMKMQGQSLSCQIVARFSHAATTDPVMKYSSNYQAKTITEPLPRSVISTILRHPEAEVEMESRWSQADVCPTLEPSLSSVPFGQLGTAAAACSIRMDRPAFCSTSEGCGGQLGARGALVPCMAGRRGGLGK